MDSEALVCHLLLICFTAETSDAKIAEIWRLFEDLPNGSEGIEGMISVQFGFNNSPEGLNKGFTHSVTIMFNSVAARDAYTGTSSQPAAPKHSALKDVFLPTIKDIIVFDYSPESNPQTFSRNQTQWSHHNVLLILPKNAATNSLLTQSTDLMKATSEHVWSCGLLCFLNQP